MSGNPISVDTLPTDVTVRSVGPQSTLESFVSQETATKTSDDSFTLNATFATRLIGDPTGGLSTGISSCVVNFLLLDCAELFISWLTPSTSIPRPPPLSPSRNCRIDSSPTWNRVCISLSPKDRNFSAQYLLALTPSSLQLASSLTANEPILTVCSVVHVFRKLIWFFVGDEPVSVTSILSGHTLGDTSCSRCCLLVCFS